MKMDTVVFKRKKTLLKKHTVMRIEIYRVHSSFHNECPPRVLVKTVECTPPQIFIEFSMPYKIHQSSAKPPQQYHNNPSKSSSPNIWIHQINIAIVNSGGQFKLALGFVQSSLQEERTRQKDECVPRLHTVVTHEPRVDNTYSVYSEWTISGVIYEKEKLKHFSLGKICLSFTTVQL